MSETFQIAIFICAGLICGSFFNVLIYRLPAGMSVVFPGSRCPRCSRPVRPWENVPVVSYLFLRGRCAGCKGKISLQYPIVEFTTVAMSLVLYYRLFLPFIQTNPVWPEYFLPALQYFSLLFLLPVTIIDFRHYIIPDSITLSGLSCAVLVALIPGGITPLHSFLGACAGGGSLLSIGLFGEFIMRKKDSMGGGDIKLMACIGALWGWKLAFLTIILAAFLGSVAGIVLILIKLLKRDQHIPFGPFLALGTWIAFLYGNDCITFYFSCIDRLSGILD